MQQRRGCIHLFRCLTFRSATRHDTQKRQRRLGSAHPFRWARCVMFLYARHGRYAASPRRATVFMRIYITGPDIGSTAARWLSTAPEDKCGARLYFFSSSHSLFFFLSRPRALSAAPSLASRITISVSTRGQRFLTCSPPASIAHRTRGNRSMAIALEGAIKSARVTLDSVPTRGQVPGSAFNIRVHLFRQHLAQSSRERTDSGR